MSNKEEQITKHEGCPNRHHCKKDDSKCCYLVKGECALNHTHLWELVE